MTEELNLLHPHTTAAQYNLDYKEAVFYTWYGRGKCSAQILRGNIDPDFDGRIPTISLLNTWIKNDFVERAKKLDDVVKTQVETQVVTDKVEMLKRHAENAVDMQNIAITYLKEHKDELKPSSAVRLWIDGVEIERKSRGLPSLITETLNSTDEELQKTIMKLLGDVDMTETEDDTNELPDL